MTTNKLCAAATAALGCPTGACRACGRTGLPILPLRRALMPSLQGPATSQGKDGLTGVNSQIGLRSLRQGYLYVLLDKKDWQAYEVTAEGALRQFDAYEFPRAAPEPLSQACFEQHHDVVASFFNLDTAKYQQAQVAFSSDPWPRSVLDAYRTGTAPVARFLELDLLAARESPAGCGLAMTPDALQVDEQVYEYAKREGGDFDSVHGFHSRAGKHESLRGYVRTAVKIHGLSQGVLALVLDDAVGLVEEYNGVRLKWIEARQKWAAEPERSYQLMTSQCLLRIREILRETHVQTAPSFEQMTGDGPPSFIGAEAERENLIKQRTQDSHARLEERYDEAARSAFQSGFDQRMQDFQARIDESAKAYARACQSPAFKLIEQHDYDGKVKGSGRCYTQTMARCLQGGISEAPEEGQINESGPSASLWKSWLDDRQSPVYRALLVRDDSLLQGLLPSFDAEGELDWDDSDKLYDAVSQVLGADEADRLLYTPMKEAAAVILGAVNAASALLGAKLAPGVARVVMRLNSASLLLYERIHVTQVKVQLSLGDFYALQCEQLRRQRGKVADQIAALMEEAHDELGEFDRDARKSIRRVRSMMTEGLLSLAVHKPAVARQMIEVTLWLEGKATEVHGRLMQGLNQGVDRTGRALQGALQGNPMRSLVVGIGTLEPAARQLLQGVQLSAVQAGQLARTGLAGMRGAAGSGSLLMALGGLYLQGQGLKNSLEEADKAIGAKHPEAMVALYGTTVGVLGGGIEVVGLAMEQSIKGVQSSGRLSAGAGTKASDLIVTGAKLAKAGAVIGAAAGLFDAVLAGIAASRSWNGGDKKAGTIYAISMGLSGMGAVAMGWVAYQGVSAIFGGTLMLGPLGWAILLGLSAYALYKWAEGEESTPMERWARRCYFGKHDEEPSVHWGMAKHADTAIAELNAAGLGVDAKLGFHSRMQAVEVPVYGGVMGGSGALTMVPHLEYQMLLPQFDAGRSAYRWSLTVHRYNDVKPGKGYVSGQVIASGAHHAPQSAGASALTLPSMPPKWKDYKEGTVVPKEATVSARSNDGSAMEVREVLGAIELSFGGKRAHNIEAATLVLTYWPDRVDKEMYAELVLKEQR